MCGREGDRGGEELRRSWQWRAGVGEGDSWDAIRTAANREIGLKLQAHARISTVFESDSTSDSTKAKVPVLQGFSRAITVLASVRFWREIAHLAEKCYDHPGGRAWIGPARSLALPNRLTSSELGSCWQGPVIPPSVAQGGAGEGRKG